MISIFPFVLLMSSIMINVMFQKKRMIELIEGGSESDKVIIGYILLKLKVNVR